MLASTLSTWAHCVSSSLVWTKYQEGNLYRISADGVMLSFPPRGKPPQLMWNRKWHMSEEAEHNDSPLIFFLKIQTVPVFVGTSLSVFGCRYKWQIFPCSMKTTPYLHSESQYTWLSCFFPLCSGTGQWHRGVGCWFRKDQRALWICLHQRVLFWFPCRFWLCLEDRHLYISLGI